MNENLACSMLSKGVATLNEGLSGRVLWFRTSIGDLKGPYTMNKTSSNLQWGTVHYSLLCLTLIIVSLCRTTLVESLAITFSLTGGRVWCLILQSPVVALKSTPTSDDMLFWGRSAHEERTRKNLSYMYTE